jgi:hypothetical protein
VELAGGGGKSFTPFRRLAPEITECLGRFFLDLRVGPRKPYEHRACRQAVLYA